MTLKYDPIGRLFEVASGPSGSVKRRFQYAPGESGLPENISEFDGGNQMTRYDGFGPGVDEPMFAWDSATGWALRTLHADERGSVVAVADGNGNSVAKNKYDEFGVPQIAANSGKFLYTGQMWLPEAGVYHYKARAYLPTWGRFMQTDPIGYGGAANLYAYVGNDPINWADPIGLCPEGERCPPPDPYQPAPIFVTGHRLPRATAGSGVVSRAELAQNPLFNDPRVTCDPALPCDEGAIITRQRLPRLGFLAGAVGGVRRLLCKIPAITYGGGADLYYFVGGSVGGGYTIDIAEGRFGVSGYSGVGVGGGANTGPNLSFSPSGGGVVSANLAVSGGIAVPTGFPGLNAGASATYNVIGTDPGWSGGTIGRVGTPSAYVNGGANIALMTPSLYDLGC